MGQKRRKQSDSKNPLSGIPQALTHGVTGLVDQARQGNQHMLELMRGGMDALGKATPWSQLDPDAVRTKAQQNVQDPTQVSQGQMNACGPAALVHCLAEYQPDRYLELIEQTLGTGKVMDKACTPGMLSGSPVQGSNDADWMMLSALRNSHPNPHSLLYGKRFEGRGDQQVSGVTAPGEMAFLSHKLFGMTGPEGKGEPRFRSNYLGGDTSELRKASDHLEEKGSSACVMLLLNATLMERQGVPGPRRKEDFVPDHWVRLMGPLVEADGRVQGTVFSWGQEMTLDMAESDWRRMVKGVLMGNVERTGQHLKGGAAGTEPKGH